MIVVLCNSFQDAQDGFDMFMNFLETYEPFSIKRVFNYSYCVETDDDLRYIFVDYRFKKLALKFDDVIDYVDMDDFFLGITEYYFDEHYSWEGAQERRSK